MLGLELGFLVVYIMAIVISVSIHEFSHAYALYLFGDHSTRTRKRLSLRPDLHFKWWGYVILLLTGVIIGNPVLIEKDEVDLKYNWYLVLIAVKLAGPLSNLITAVIAFFVIKYIEGCPNIKSDGYESIAFFLVLFAFVNVLLFVLNMIPVPLLDGGVLLLVIGMIFDIEEFVSFISLVSVVLLLILFNVFPDNPFVVFVSGIFFKIMDALKLWIVGKGAL